MLWFSTMSLDFLWTKLSSLFLPLFRLSYTQTTVTAGSSPTRNQDLLRNLTETLQKRKSAYSISDTSDPNESRPCSYFCNCWKWRWVWAKTFLQVFLSLLIGMTMLHLFLSFLFLAEQSSSLKRACFSCSVFETRILMLQPSPTQPNWGCGCV